MLQRSRHRRGRSARPGRIAPQAPTPPPDAPAKGLRPTAEGWRLILLLAVMGFAAFNTRNNLLFMMFSLGIATVLVAMTSGWLSVRRVAVASGAPGDFYAATSCRKEIRLRNRSRFFDAFGVELSEIDYPGRMPRDQLPRLGRGESASVVLDKLYPHRGEFEDVRLRVSSRYPFGLFRCGRDLELPRKQVVFPRVHRVSLGFVFRDQHGSLPQKQRRGESEELLRLRDYQVGDNFHHIHWKASAKLDRLIVREFAHEERRRFCLLLDNVSASNGSDVSPADFEALVSGAASIASHLASHALDFRLVSAGQAFPLGSSDEHLRGALTHLARVTLIGDSAEDVMSQGRQALSRQECVLALTAPGLSGFVRMPGEFAHVLTPRDFEEGRSGDDAQAIHSDHHDSLV